MPFRVCSEAGQRPCRDTDLLSSSNLGVFTIQLASTQHKTTTYIHYHGVTEVLNEGRILLSLTDKSLLHTFPPALEVLCHFITTKFIADKPRSGNHVSRMALIHMIV